MTQIGKRRLQHDTFDGCTRSSVSSVISVLGRGVDYKLCRLIWHAILCMTCIRYRDVNDFISEHGVRKCIQNM